MVTVQAPPATVLWQALHFQMPTAWRLTESCCSPQYAVFRVSALRKTCLAAEGAGVACVLGDFHLEGRGNLGFADDSHKTTTHLLHLLTERGTVTLQSEPTISSSVPLASIRNRPATLLPPPDIEKVYSQYRTCR